MITVTIILDHSFKRRSFHWSKELEMHMTKMTRLYNTAVRGILKRSVTIYLLDNARNSRRMRMWSICCFNRLDCKESVSRGQNTTLYNRIFIYNLAVLKSYNQQIENNILKYINPKQAGGGGRNPPTGWFFPLLCRNGKQ